MLALDGLQPHNTWAAKSSGTCCLNVCAWPAAFHARGRLFSTSQHAGDLCMSADVWFVWPAGVQHAVAFGQKVSGACGP
jgi:hypothetical protein